MRYGGSFLSWEDLFDFVKLESGNCPLCDISRVHQTQTDKMVQNRQHPNPQNENEDNVRRHTIAPLIHIPVQSLIKLSCNESKEYKQKERFSASKTRAREDADIYVRKRSMSMADQLKLN